MMHGGKSALGGLRFSLTVEDTGLITSYDTSNPKTLSGVSIGTPRSDRQIIFVMSDASNGSATASSVTCGGVSMTRQINGQDSFRSCQIWTANVPTGTTASIVVTATGTGSWYVQTGVVLSLYGSFTRHDLISNTTGDRSLSSLEVTAGDVVIHGVGFQEFSSSSNWSLSGSPATPESVQEQTALNGLWASIINSTDSQTTVNQTFVTTWSPDTEGNWGVGVAVSLSPA